MKRYSIIFSIFALALLFSCGSKEKPESKPAEESASSTASNVVELSISGNDQMQYDKKVLEVPAGSTVKLTLIHSGKMTKDVMGHNWTLLKQDVNVDAFAAKAMTAKETDYIAPDQEAEVIVHTKTLGGGESETIEFKAPAPGTYKFLCTFPGHYAMMQGDFIVK